MEDFESPAFEPLEGYRPASALKKEESNDSHVSGISGLTSQDSVKSEKDEDNDKLEEGEISDEGEIIEKESEVILEDASDYIEFKQIEENLAKPNLENVKEFIVDPFEEFDIEKKIPEDEKPFETFANQIAKVPPSVDSLNIPAEVQVNSVPHIFEDSDDGKPVIKTETINPILLEGYSQDSVLSQVSSNSRLSIITHSTSPQMDMFDTAQMPRFDSKLSGINLKTDNKVFPTSFDDVKDEIKMDIKEESQVTDIKMTIMVDVKEEDSTHSSIKLESVEGDSNIDIKLENSSLGSKPENETTKFEDNSDNKNPKADVKEEFASPKNVNGDTRDSLFNDPEPPKQDSRDKDRSRHLSSSSHRKHDRDKERERERDRSDKDRDRDRDRNRHDSSSSKSRSSSSKHRHHSSSSSRDASERSDDRKKSSSSSYSSLKYKSSSTSDHRHHERSSSSSKSNQRDKDRDRDRDRHHSSSSKDYKKSSSDKYRSSKSSSGKHRDSDRDKDRDRERVRDRDRDRDYDRCRDKSESSKKRRSISNDRKKKYEDDHASERPKQSEKRRSTDRDSNDESNSGGCRSSNKESSKVIVSAPPAENTNANLSTNSPNDNSQQDNLVTDSAIIDVTPTSPISIPISSSSLTDMKKIVEPINGTLPSEIVLKEKGFDGHMESMISGHDTSNPEKDSGK